MKRRDDDVPYLYPALLIAILAAAFVLAWVLA